MALRLSCTRNWIPASRHSDTSLPRRLFSCRASTAASDFNSVSSYCGERSLYSSVLSLASFLSGSLLTAILSIPPQVLSSSCPSSPARRPRMLPRGLAQAAAARGIRPAGPHYSSGQVRRAAQRAPRAGNRSIQSGRRPMAGQLCWHGRGAAVAHTTAAGGAT